MRGTRLYAILAATFMAGVFLASPELRAYAANTVFSTDIVDGEVKTPDIATNAVTAAKIKDGEVKAAEIATDAVGAAELQGVTKLLFGQCDLTNAEDTISLSPGFGYTKTCTIGGVDSDDTVVATMAEGGGNSCMSVTKTNSVSGAVQVTFRNACTSSSSAGTGAMIALIVYDK